MWEGDDHGAVLIDSLDGALDALEGTCNETDGATFLAEEIGIGNEAALMVGIVDLHGADEIVHLALGDGDDH